MNKLIYTLTLLSFLSFINCSKRITTGVNDRNVNSAIIPETVLNGGPVGNSLHPFATQINQFLMASQQSAGYRPSGLKKEDYLHVIDRQVRAMLKYQDNDGRIVDPVEKVEKYYTTPCYAHSVAALVASSYIQPNDPLAISGMKALDVSLLDMVNATVNGNHGDFYTWPVMFAYELFKSNASNEQIKSWDQKLKNINPSKLYQSYDKPTGNNWVLVHTAGEFLRAKHNFTTEDYVERMLSYQLSNFTKEGMYNEHGNPMAYDLFSRHYMCGMLFNNYNGRYYEPLKNILWKGAWMSLFMQSPFGELPAGYRSSHHIWNEAEQCVVFEIYANEYAKLGMTKEAGIFKRAAMLSLNSIKNWVREDGSGYIVKNRYPIEARHGYEAYSVHTCYNMLACSMLAQAWQFAGDAIDEKPAPADVGGFVLPVLHPFHKIFANAGGTYLEYDTNGDQKYNPTGIIRMHIKGGHPQLGPSDGAASLFSGKGVSLATGLSWQNSDGSWSSLAQQKRDPVNLEVLEESPESVKFRVVYQWEEPTEGTILISETIQIANGIITVNNEIKGVHGLKRLNWPMLVFDGKNKVDILISHSSAELQLEGRGLVFSVLDSSGSKLRNSSEKLIHRNGLVETVYLEFTGDKISYQFKAK